MSCDACNTPTTPAIAAPRSAVLTNPVTAPSQSCYTPPENPCSPPVSRLRNLGKYVPGWVQKLTPAAMGRLVITVGDALHYFRPNNPGPLYFDGENVTVGGQPTLTAKATEDSLVEFGHLTLAKKVSRAQILPDGSPATLEFFEHGVQAVREIGVGEMMGLTTDPASGSVRADVIQPEARDLIKKGLPAEFRRLGYAQTQVQGPCGLREVKKFYDYRGGVFGDDEILLDREAGLPAVLVPVKTADGLSYTLGTDAFVESEGVTEEQFDELTLRIPVIEPIYGDAECPTKVTGLRRFYIPFPEFLSIGATLSNEILLNDPIEVFTQSQSSGATSVLDETILPHEDVPENADYVLYSIYASAEATAGSGTRVSGVNFSITESVSSEDPEFVRASDTAYASSTLSGIAATSVKATTVKIKIREGGCKLIGDISTFSSGTGGSNLASIQVFLVGYGQTGVAP